LLQRPHCGDHGGASGLNEFHKPWGHRLGHGDILPGLPGKRAIRVTKVVLHVNDYEGGMFGINLFLQ
jgi:hypothetical protein